MSRTAVFLLALSILLPRAARAQEAPADTADEIRRAVEMAEVEKRPSFVDRAAAARLAEEAYPASLKAAGIAGTTVVRLVVDSRGQPVGVRVAEPSGYPDLDAAALKVVRALRFVPAERGGAPHPVWVSFPVAFVPPDPDAVAGVSADEVKAWGDSANALAPSQVHSRPSVTGGGEALREYPRELAEAGMEGKATVWLVVTGRGEPRAARVAVSGGHPEIDRAALRAVERLRFSPARVGNVPVDAWMALPVEFKRPSERTAAAADTGTAYEMEEVEEIPELRNRSEVAREISRVYPPVLRDQGVGGTVVIRMRLDERGNPTNMDVTRSDHPELALAALRVVERMRFSPARVGGKPARVWVSIPVTFAIAGPPPGPEPMQPTPLGRDRRDPWGRPRP